MAVVTTFRMPVKTTHFNANQKVFVVSMTGDLAALCVGKFRGKGRYVKAWVKWGTATKPTPTFQNIDIDNGFAERHGLWTK